MNIVDTSTQEANYVVSNPRRINKMGKLLLQLGKITHENIDQILELQQKDGLLFGDAAMKLGFINSSDVQQVVAMQFNYHYLQAGQGNFSPELIAAYEPFTDDVESYRALRSQLMLRWFQEGNRCLSLVSPNQGDGISYLASNLAVVFAQLGARTLLIDANMRNPKQHKIFNVDTPIGLSDIIVGRTGMNSIKEVEAIEDLNLLTAGTIPPNPQELLGRASFSYLMKIVSEHYDIVLVDTPPAIASADAQTITAHTGGALVVSRLNHTKLADLQEVKNNITLSGAKIVGAVINEF